MTQELIANMMGVRREGVTEAALKLQEADLISYSWPYYGVRPRGVREAHLRMLCGCQKRVRSLASGKVGDIEQR
jgi:Mn-dependent DtxR family transcriptional regulator